jgi:hypothetical protein
MADKLSDRDIYKRLDQAVDLFKGELGATEGGQAVIELFQRNTDMIQRAMLIMLSENRPQTDHGSEPRRD